jgi:hypothetical protein
MLISVESKLAIYHHVIVGLWREMVIDYKSMYTYSLTEDTSRQICGVNTTFQQISGGYDILPSIICKALQGIIIDLECCVSSDFKFFSKLMNMTISTDRKYE